MIDLKRALTFLVFCIGLRGALAYTAYAIPTQYLPYMGYAALIPAIGFLTIYLFGLRETGMEVGGEKIWWNHLRPVHSFLYFAFAISAIRGDRRAWVFLFVDVVIGLLSFIDKRFVYPSA